MRLGDDGRERKRRITEEERQSVLLIILPSHLTDTKQDGQREGEEVEGGRDVPLNIMY